MALLHASSVFVTLALVLVPYGMGLSVLGEGSHHGVDAPSFGHAAQVQTLVKPKFDMSFLKMASDCKCVFNGLCTCAQALEFMRCIEDACQSARCDCEDKHINYACGNMSTTCPSVGLTCSMQEASCMSGTQQEIVRGVEARHAPHAQTTEPTTPTEENQWAVSLPSFTQSLQRYMIYAAVEILLVVICAFIYNKYRHEMYSAQTVSSIVTRDHFKYKLFSCHEDPQICLPTFLCCCVFVPLRWADTMDKVTPKRLLRFWPALVVYLCVSYLAPLVPLLGSIAFVVFVTFFRVELRKQYKLQVNPKTILTDFFTWCCCGPCAIVQEARHVESSYKHVAQHNSMA